MIFSAWRYFDKSYSVWLKMPFWGQMKDEYIYDDIRLRL
jgi:hypothetical protein